MAGNRELSSFASKFEDLPAADGVYYVVRNKALVALPTIVTSGPVGVTQLSIAGGATDIPLSVTDTDYETIVLTGAIGGQRNLQLPAGTVGNWSIVCTDTFNAGQYVQIEYITGGQVEVIRVHGGTGVRIAGTGTQVYCCSGASRNAISSSGVMHTSSPSPASSDTQVPTTQWVRLYGPGVADLATVAPLAAANAAAVGVSTKVARQDHVHPTLHGYTTGAGGTVVQTTSRATAVTLNKLCGRITLFSASTTAGQVTTFTVNNSTVAATDAIAACVQTATTGNYFVGVSAVATGSFKIHVFTPAAHSSETVALAFAVNKATII